MLQLYYLDSVSNFNRVNQVAFYFTQRLAENVKVLLIYLYTYLFSSLCDDFLGNFKIYQG